MIRALLLSLLLAGCDICPDADYEFKDNGSTLSCKNYDDKYVYDGEYCKVVSCIWDCAHAGGSCQYVDLTFTSCESGGWELESIFTAECI